MEVISDEDESEVPDSSRTFFRHNSPKYGCLIFFGLGGSWIGLGPLGVWSVNKQTNIVFIFIDDDR